MPVVSSFDWANRRIYMAVAEWHPIDVYREHREARRLDEAARKFDPLISYSGNIAKGGGRFTPRFATMLSGAKIVPVDGATAPVTTITGEVITDDASEFIDASSLAVKPMVKYQPPEAEIIQVSTSGNEYTLEEIGQSMCQQSVESDFSLRDTLRLILAAMCGDASGLNTSNPSFKDLSGQKVRIAGSIANGVRTITTLDPS